MFGNEPSKPQQQIQENGLGSINLYGNQSSSNNNNLIGGLTGLNLYGTQPQVSQNNNTLGGFNITMQTGIQPSPVQQQPQNTGGFNFLGTSPAPSKLDTNFLGLGGNTTSSAGSSQIIKGYENQQIQINLNCSK